IEDRGEALGLRRGDLDRYLLGGVQRHAPRLPRGAGGVNQVVRPSRDFTGGGFVLRLKRIAMLWPMRSATAMSMRPSRSKSPVASACGGRPNVRRVRGRNAPG